MERILVIGLSNDRGGIENYIINLYEHIDRSEIQFDFLVKEEITNDFKERIEALGGHIYVCGTFKKNILNVWKKLTRFYKVNKYKKIYVNFSYSLALIYILPAIDNGLEVLYLHSHASDDIRKVKHRIGRFIFYKFFLNKVDCIYMGCSKEACQWQFGYDICKNNKIHVINNAIDCKRFQYSSENRRKLRLKYCIEDQFVIGHVGRFSDEKNHAFMIELIKRLNKLESKYKLLLIGDGIKKDKIEKLALQNKVIDDVIFVGNVADTAPYYSAMDCFILPSKYEGFPIVSVEAQVNGLKCLFSDVITKKVDLFGESKFLSTNNIEQWINSIKKFKMNDLRSNTTENYKSREYDLNNESAKVASILKI